MIKICKKCGSDKRIPVKRKNSKTGVMYMTSKCKDCMNTYNKKNRHISLNWQRNNRERISEYQKNYYNYQVRNAQYSKRLTERTPAWANKEKILKIYTNCPKGHHVDHIIPLNGKTVSGLHVEGNLQYLTKENNLRKNNKF